MKSLERYLSRLSPSTQKINRFIVRSWYEWLQEQDTPFTGYSLDELVDYQREEKDYEILDTVQGWILERKNLRTNTLQKYYSTVNSFFAHNRTALPPDPSFKITHGMMPVVGKLRVEHIVRVIEVSNPMYRAFWLCVVQGFMGLHEAIYWSNNGYGKLIEDLEAERCPIRIDFPGGRKSNPEQFYTFIGDDAIRALRDYLELCPSEGEAIFLTRYKTPMSTSTARRYWINTLQRIGIIDPITIEEQQQETIRYGYNAHEIRDVMRSRWRLSGVDKEVAEFFMGHNLDRYNYDKSPKHYPEWFKDQYKKALPWLNLLSQDPDLVPKEEYESTFERQQLEINDLKYELLEMKTMLRNLAEGEKIVEKLKEKNSV